MKKHFLKCSYVILTLLSFCCNFCIGQSTFEKIYATVNYDVAQGIETTYDDGFILVGVSGVVYDTCTADIIITKCDVDGTIEWSNLYSMPTCDQGYDIKQTSDHGYIIGGASIGFASNQMVLIKIDSIGNVEWQKLYSSNNYDEICQIFPLPDDGFLVAGYRYNFTNYGYDMTLTRVNSTGDVLWSKVYLTLGAEYGLIQIYDNGDDTYFLTCTNLDFNSFPLNENFYLLHVDASGNVLTSRQYGNSDTDEKGWGIIKIEPNRYWLIGHSGGTGDALLLQIDSFGTVLWAKRYNDGTYLIDESSMTSFLYLPEYGLFICGFDGFYNPYSFLIDKGDAFLFRVDDEGSVAWWKDYGDTQAWYWEAFFRMQEASDGNLLMAGGRTTNGNYDDQTGWDMYVVKTNLQGETGCEINMNVNVFDIDIAMTDYAVADSNLSLTETIADFIVIPAADVITFCAGFPTATASSSDIKEIFLYPNPADEMVIVNSSSSLQAAEIRFYDVLGKETFHSTNLTDPITVSGLSSGIYLYKVADEKGSVIASGKIYIGHGER